VRDLLGQKMRTSRGSVAGLVVCGLTLAGCSSAGSLPHTSDSTGPATGTADPHQGPRGSRPARLIEHHNTLGIYWHPPAGRCHGPGVHVSEGLQYGDGGRPYRGRMSLTFRDVSNTMPQAVTPLRVISISPTGRLSSAYLALPRGLKTLHNVGQDVTYPDDFHTRHGNRPGFQKGVYTVLLETLTHQQIVCTGFVSASTHG
jgi:hypothetical protein